MFKGFTKRYAIHLMVVLLVYTLVLLPVYGQVAQQVVVLSGGAILYPNVSPTQIPTPVLHNLASIPSHWYLTYSTGPQIIHLDSSVTYNGEASVRLDKHTSADVNTARECNTGAYSIKPGDHIVFSCWMKTTESGYGDTNPFSGARIGIDFWNSGGRINGLASDGQHGLYPNEQSSAVQEFYVPWGSDWTLKIIDFIVPQKMTADGFFGYPAGTSQTPSAMILWMQVWSSTYGSTDPGHAWFANAQLYINP